MANFAPVGDVPQTGLSQWEAQLLGALKENVEVMTGARVAGLHVLMSDLVTVDPLGPQTMTQISATGTATVGDFQALMIDVQKLSNDMYDTRNKINALIAQLKG